MKKIISLFQRNYEGDRLVRDEVVPGAEWVIAGEGIATEKFDGTCCMIQDGVLYKRYDAKHGKTPPEGFLPAQRPDPITGHWPGWLVVKTDDPADIWHIEVLPYPEDLPDATYELVGPKIQGNKYDLKKHKLIRHGSIVLPSDIPRDFEGLKSVLNRYNIEGIVFYHPDGRMVKIKKKDFGFKW